MSRYSIKLFAVVLFSIAIATTAFAADDGQTQPKLNVGNIGNGITAQQDAIGTTSGAGNVKGVQCTSSSSSQLGATTINIFVNGGSAQALSLGVAQLLEDSASNFYTDWIPMNVRFTSSIRVQVSGNQSGAGVSCTVSWAID